jgi:ABC-2 type transport system permease protein
MSATATEPRVAAPHGGEAKTSAVAVALARRSVTNVFRVPGAFVPILVMPMFFLLSFSGSFSDVTRIPTFPTPHILNWVMPYAILQGAAFAGMGTAFSVARDLENGFYDRFLLAPAPRWALLAGPALAAMSRALLPTAIVFAVASAGGARVTDGVLSIVPLLFAVEGAAVIACFWGLGVALRFKTQRSLALVQVVIFSFMFLSAAQMPVHLIQGWVKPIAQLNPVTNILRLAREGLLPGGVNWQDTWGGVVAVVASSALLAWFATRGLRKLDN